MKDLAQKKIIIETAHGKFRRFGIRRVSMDEIARDLRMSKKTLYQYFSGKEDLVRGVIASVQSQILPHMQQALLSRDSVVERFGAVWKVILRFPQYVSNEMLVDLKAEYPHLWEEVDQQRKKVFGFIEGLITEGIESGEVNSSIHPKVYRAFVLAVVDKVMIPETLAKGEFSPADIIRTMVTLMQSGLFAENAKDAAGQGEA